MRVLIIGLGSIAKKHIDALRVLYKELEVYALRSTADSAKYQDVINLSSLDNISTYNFDFAIISNPTAKHYETLAVFKDLNIPLFIEKPLFGDVGEDESKLVDFYTDNLAVTYVACNLRFLSCLQEIKIILKDKRINEVNVYCGSYLPEWRPNVDFRSVYSANKEMGGGVHLDLIHELDYLYWVLGAPIKSTASFSSKSSLEISSYDYANYLWAYNGFMANVVLNYFRRDAKRSFEIVCESETYRVDLLKNVIYRNEEVIFSSDQKPSDTYLAQMRFFLTEVVGNGTNFNSIKEAYKILNLCLNV